MASLAHCGLRWDHTPPSIEAAASALMREADGVLDGVARALVEGGAAACTWRAVVAPLAALDRDLEARLSSITFPKDVSPDKDVRAAAAAAQAALSAWEVRASMRMDVYAAVSAYAAEHLAAERAAGMDAEALRFVERWLRDARRRGLTLPEGARARVEALRTRMTAACVEFQQRLSEDDTKLHFPREALAGMPDDFVGGLARRDEDGALEVGLSYPHVVPLLQLCAVPATRAAVERAFNSKGHPANTALLEELAALRRDEAAALGYASHAAYVLETRMAASPATVEAFLAQLARDVRPLLETDLASLNARKAAAEGAGAGPICMSDYRYYMEQELREVHAVDQNEVRAYFPLERVLEGMLGMYQKMLSLVFTRLPSGGAPVWHPEVTAYEVKDAVTAEVLGFFFLDLHPRPGKYSHAAVFPLLSSCEEGPVEAAGSSGAPRSPAVAAMVCNFTKPTAAAPSLLRHQEVVTLLHEFGHVAHHLCSRTRLHAHASFKCESDFVEAPSQMLESFVWQPAMLQALSSHWETSAPLPLALAQRLAASRSVHAGLFNSRQVCLAQFDQALHALPAEGADAPRVDSVALLSQLHRDVVCIPLTEGTHFGASFAHLVGGYNALYYGYAWANVFAADMFAAAFEADPLDPVAGRRYREHILASGGAVDASCFVARFLGREPSNVAFLKQIGLGGRAAAS